MSTGIRDLVVVCMGGGAVVARLLVPLKQERLRLEDTGPVKQTLLLRMYIYARISTYALVRLGEIIEW